MNIKISKWCGRLGNNIQQVINCLKIAYYTNCNIILPKHNFFNKTVININDEFSINDKILLIDHFFNIRLILNKLNINTGDLFSFEDRSIKIKIKAIIKDLFIIKSNKHMGNNTLTIYIRSGDIFDKKPHPKYIMPPLSYYENIIVNNNYKKIILVSEDTKNPVINTLINKYNIEYSKNTLSTDIEIILSSRNIVGCFGTFLTSLLCLSETIENIYLPSYSNRIPLELDNINIYYTELDKYYKKQFPWKNNREQQQYMLEYKN